MSIFASRITKTIPIPFDPPHEVTLQKLAGRHLGKAHDAFLADLYQGVRDRGGSAVQKDMQALFEGDKKADAEAAVAKVQADPLNGYDPYVLVRHGVKGWSYDTPLSPEAIEDLDDEAVTFFATEIMRLTKPALFQTEEAAKAAQKETDAAPSFAGR
jgi:hypothetical protein